MLVVNFKLLDLCCLVCLLNLFCYKSDIFINVSSGILRLVARGHQDDQGRLPRGRVPRVGDDLHRDRSVREASGQEFRAAPRSSHLHPTLGAAAARNPELLQRLARRETARTQQGSNRPCSA